MGKKSKRHAAHSGTAKPAAGSLINNKTVCKVVEELWTQTQGQSSANLAGLWKEYDEIVALTTTVREKQGPSSSQLPAREEGFEGFYDWLKANNAEFDKVEVGLFGGVGYGVKAKADVEMGERVMRIPEKLMMTSDTAKASQLGPLIARDRMLQVMPNVALALHLLNERYNPKSFWKPYINILPASYSLPLWFSRSQLELLQGSPCLADALQHFRSVGKLYSHLHKLLRAHGDTSFYLYSVGFYFEDFVWAVSTVMSRQNEIPQKDEKQTTLALIPLWDMCNHWLGTISTDFNPELRTCDCFSPNAVKAGKELRIFYGARSNAELFLHQGFVYPPNTGDSLRIKMGLSSGEDSATKAMKSKLLTKLDIPLSGIFHLLAAEDPFNPQLKAFVRVFTAKAEDLQHYSGVDSAALKTELVTERWSQRDLPALQFLIQRCELLLKTYGSTVFEDFEKVTQTKLDDRTHQALMLTICERCILGSAVKTATAHKATLERGEERKMNGTTEERAEGEDAREDAVTTGLDTREDTATSGEGLDTSNDAVTTGEGLDTSNDAVTTGEGLNTSKEAATAGEGLDMSVTAEEGLDTREEAATAGEGLDTSNDAVTTGEGLNTREKVATAGEGLDMSVTTGEGLNTREKAATAGEGLDMSVTTGEGLNTREKAATAGEGLDMSVTTEEGLDTREKAVTAGEGLDRLDMREEAKTVRSTGEGGPERQTRLPANELGEIRDGLLLHNEQQEGERKKGGREGGEREEGGREGGEREGRQREEGGRGGEERGGEGGERWEREEGGGEGGEREETEREEGGGEGEEREEGGREGEVTGTEEREGRDRENGVGEESVEREDNEDKKGEEDNPNDEAESRKHDENVNTVTESTGEGEREREVDGEEEEVESTETGEQDELTQSSV